MEALSSRQIRAVRTARTTTASRTMVVHGRHRGDTAPPAVAIVASRAVGNAVARNRAKRRLRAAARQARLPQAMDLVVDARRASLDAPFTQLHRDLERLSARVARKWAR